MNDRLSNLKNCTVRSGTKNRYKGISGYKHQIDVSFEDDDKIGIIECKRYVKKVSTKDILVLITRQRDIALGYRKKVFASLFITKGFTAGAQTLAKHYNRE